MATFLLEIGSEELPADFVRLALPQLRQRVEDDLVAARLTWQELRVTGTPRRLAVLIGGLATRQEDRREDRKGPPAATAFAEGSPTAAALGFAGRCGVPAEALEVRPTPKGDFVFAQVLEPGQPTTTVLQSLIPEWIWGLQGRRFMRWGAGESRFSRPVRWLVALLDDEVVPVDLVDCDPVVSSGRLSRGDRLSQQPLAIARADVYFETLAAAAVMADRDGRAATIGAEIKAAAQAAAGVPDLPEALFDELVDLVEAPQVLTGSLDERYLALPPEVLSTVMRSHQRYVPLGCPGALPDSLALEARDLLLSRFLFVANGRDPAAADTVRRGNERVLRARLDDAAFFVRADRSVASIDRRDQLDRVAFAEGLGSLLDRTQRLEWFTDALLEALALAVPTAAAAAARRAAHLCKHDLVSQMVAEFPELQGVMGGKYLLAEGEPRAVALAVQEHYLPRGAGDSLPTSDAGAVVALAERLELLLSSFARGERPSGSSDPYGLRRAGNGILQILWDRGWTLDLVALLQRSCRHWAAMLPDLEIDAISLEASMVELLRQRLVSQLEEEGFDGDLVEAVAGETVLTARLLGDPADARRRLLLLADLRHQGQLAALQTVVQRASRLAAKGDLDLGALGPEGRVDVALFNSPSEAAMLGVIETLRPYAQAQDGSGYGALAQGLAQSASTLANFFDGPQSVLVMADDPAVRRNRLNLLGILRNQAAQLADFNCLSG
jgi:glycyl-tRNA synthetase beta chain